MGTTGGGGIDSLGRGQMSGGGRSIFARVMTHWESEKTALTLDPKPQPQTLINPKLYSK
jgi:hypothetical protein